MTVQYDRRTAIFAPQRTDDLKHEVNEWIGRALEWEAAWIIEDGPYKDQWAWTPILADDDEPRPPFAWAPECDLRTEHQP